MFAFTKFQFIFQVISCSSGHNHNEEQNFLIESSEQIKNLGKQTLFIPDEVLPTSTERSFIIIHTPNDKSNQKDRNDQKFVNPKFKLKNNKKFKNRNKKNSVNFRNPAILVLKNRRLDGRQNKKKYDPVIVGDIRRRTAPNESESKRRFRHRNSILSDIRPINDRVILDNGRTKINDFNRVTIVVGNNIDGRDSNIEHIFIRPKRPTPNKQVQPIDPDYADLDSLGLLGTFSATAANHVTPLNSFNVPSGGTRAPISSFNLLSNGINDQFELGNGVAAGYPLASLDQNIAARKHFHSLFNIQGPPTHTNNLSPSIQNLEFVGHSRHFNDVFTNVGTYFDTFNSGGGNKDMNSDNNVNSLFENSPSFHRVNSIGIAEDLGSIDITPLSSSNFPDKFKHTNPNVYRTPDLLFQPITTNSLQLDTIENQLLQIYFWSPHAKKCIKTYTV